MTENRNLAARAGRWSAQHRKIAIWGWIGCVLAVFDRGRSTEEAVAHGIKSTAGVVTSAAVVMVSVFAIFATLSLLIFKQLGIGLAVAVLFDATLVRGVLLPATMKLLGDWNWYLPGWLEWLPHVGPGDGRGLPPDSSRPQPEAHPA